MESLGYAIGYLIPYFVLVLLSDWIFDISRRLFPQGLTRTKKWITRIVTTILLALVFWMLQ